MLSCFSLSALAADISPGHIVDQDVVVAPDYDIICVTASSPAMDLPFQAVDFQMTELAVVASAPAMVAVKLQEGNVCPVAADVDRIRSWDRYLCRSARSETNAILTRWKHLLQKVPIERLV